MRGKGYLEPFYSIYHRITPAYAGKSHFMGVALLNYKDHPRLCGEKSITGLFRDSHKGSPPPMRGKGYMFVGFWCFVGITPAYAGKSTNCFQICGFGEDHPRLCGEKHVTRIFQQRATGSPPPMRGKGYLYKCPKYGRGITPAYAGKRSPLHEKDHLG